MQFPTWDAAHHYFAAIGNRAFTDPDQRQNYLCYAWFRWQQNPSLPASMIAEHALSRVRRGGQFGKPYARGHHAAKLVQGGSETAIARAPSREKDPAKIAEDRDSFRFILSRVRGSAERGYVRVAMAKERWKSVLLRLGLSCNGLRRARLALRARCEQ